MPHGRIDIWQIRRRAKENPANDLPEPRWPAIAAVLAACVLYAGLPVSLTVGPRWLQLIVVCVLLVPSIISHKRGNHVLNQVIGHIIEAVMTIFMIWSLVLLVRALPLHAESPMILLRSAAALWITNLLVFALWYWRLDAGGPHGRHSRGGYTDGAFLFPRMMSGTHTGTDEKAWSPRFIDYLFIAFNTSTAFSPTDTPVLSRWAKALSMIQSTISLTTTVILAARAVNTL